MARTKRVVAVGCPHHVTQRGNYRQDVFFSEQDRSVYLSLRQVTPPSTTCACSAIA